MATFNQLYGRDAHLKYRRMVELHVELTLRDVNLQSIGKLDSISKTLAKEVQKIASDPINRPSEQQLNHLLESTLTRIMEKEKIPIEQRTAIQQIKDHVVALHRENFDHFNQLTKEVKLIKKRRTIKDLMGIGTGIAVLIMVLVGAIGCVVSHTCLLLLMAGKK